MCSLFFFSFFFFFHTCALPLFNSGLKMYAQLGWACGRAIKVLAPHTRVQVWLAPVASDLGLRGGGDGTTPVGELTFG